MAHLYYEGRDLCQGRKGGGAVQIKDADGRVVHCDLDSMDLGLLIAVHFEIGGRNVVWTNINTLPLCLPSLPSLRVW